MLVHGNIQNRNVETLRVQSRDLLGDVDDSNTVVTAGNLWETCSNESEICGNTAVMRMTIAGITAEMVGNTPMMHSKLCCSGHSSDYQYLMGWCWLLGREKKSKVYVDLYSMYTRKRL